MTPEAMIEWINGATYDQLLSRWRFAPIGSPWFQGKVGEHYQKVMANRRKEVGRSGHVRASKSIGWR